MKTLSANSVEATSSIPSTIKTRWGDAIGTGGMTGFTALPNALIRGQKRLGLNSTEMMVLINILMHWWTADKRPFPSNASIAKRIGISERTVQRVIARLDSESLLQRVYSHSDGLDNGSPNSRREIDLNQLVHRLSDISNDLQAFSDDAAEARKSQQQSLSSTS